MFFFNYEHDEGLTHLLDQWKHTSVGIITTSERRKTP